MPAAIEPLRAGLADAYGVRALYIAADMSKPAEIAATGRPRPRRSLGAVDILVNNAGSSLSRSIDDFPAERWDAMIAINLSAVFHAMKAAFPGMKARGWGRIINIASAHGLVASAAEGRVCRRQARPRRADQGGGDRDRQCTASPCNAICPGWVLTPLVEKQIGGRARQQGIAVEQASAEFLREKQPMPTFTTPEKIGALAVFLCVEAAATITGAPLSIDGGWVAQ